MQTGFPSIGGNHAGIGGENSFWPSFTDIMMVITMIFLMATSLLVVRNWQLVAELQESIAAEQIASELIESTSQENATLEERLANAEQGNSILRLRLLKKEEELKSAQLKIRQQQSGIAALELRTTELEQSLERTQAQLETANLEIDATAAARVLLSQQLASINQQLAQQTLAREQNLVELRAAQDEIAKLIESRARQQLSISQLTQEKSQLRREVDSYDQQLLTLQGEYDTVKSKYEELIKPARSAQGKVIAHVYYVKDESGDVIRFRGPGDADSSRINRSQVEERLDLLKAKHGQELYVKIIIPQDSGLTYNEAWEFMRELLVKYDYYYQ